MRVSILSESFDPNKGYLEYYLARELTRLKSDVKIFTFQRRRDILECQVDGFRVIRIPPFLDFHGYNLFTLRKASRMIKILKEEPLEIVHCQPLFSPLSLFSMTLERAFNYGIVGSLITGELSVGRLPARLEFDSVRFLVKKYVDRKTDVVFALSDDVRNLLFDMFHVSLDKIHVVPLGADHILFRFNPETRRRTRDSLGLSRDDLVIVYTGKIIPSKQLDLLVKALASLKSIDKSVKLLFIGDGPLAYVDWLKKLAKSMGVHNRMVFHSSVHRTKLPEYYSASDIGVWPGSPSISILEAMSSGLPVVIRRSFVSNCELEYGNGFSFDHSDLSALISCLHRLISDEELRAEMGKRSRALVEDKLNWRKIAITYLGLYKMAYEK